MLKFLARDSVVFDVETVPDANAGRRLITGEHWPIDRQVIDAMFADHPDYDADTNPRPFLKPILQQVVSIAYVRRNDAGLSLRVIDGDEATMVRRFLAGIGEHKPQLVGFNSEGFDLPLLVQRALVHGITAKAFCARPDKPWEGRDYHARYSEWHVDLMRELGGFGKSMPSLSEACAALNILGGAKDVTGADVLDLYLAGDLAAIRQYNAKDAVRHFLILLRLCVLAGHVAPDEAAREEADVCAQLDAYCGAGIHESQGV